MLVSIWHRALHIYIYCRQRIPYYIILFFFSVVHFDGDNVIITTFGSRSFSIIIIIYFRSFARYLHTPSHTYIYTCIFTHSHTLPISFLLTLTHARSNLQQTQFFSLHLNNNQIIHIGFAYMYVCTTAYYYICEMDMCELYIVQYLYSIHIYMLIVYYVNKSKSNIYLLSSRKKIRIYF